MVRLYKNTSKITLEVSRETADRMIALQPEVYSIVESKPAEKIQSKKRDESPKESVES
jgi:hypothetical protein